MSANYVFISQGAESPVIPFEFTDELGNPLDLSGDGVKVVFRMRPWNSSVYVINDQLATILSATQGTGYYAVNGSDTAVPGHYLGKWVINPGKLIMPVDGYVHVIIGPD